MKQLLYTFIFFLVICVSVYAQKNKTPKNLKKAVVFLSLDCPDSLKKVIVETVNDELIYLCYPWGGTYKTIFEWTKSDNKKSRLKKYLVKNRIENNEHQQQVILLAFKQHLLGNRIKQKEILKPYKAIEEKWRKEDLIRFFADSIRGVYIPKDIEDCVKQINKFWSDSIKDIVKQLSEDEFSARAHMSFGMWMRNNWQLWGGSRLSVYFNDLKIYHPDDMSGIILDSYHRYLTGKEIKLDEQIKFYQDYWENSKKQQQKRQEEEFSYYKIGDTLEYNYNKGFVSKAQEEKFDNDDCNAKGIITDRNESEFLIKVSVIETCDKKGIIYYDNDGVLIYNSKTKKWSDPPKRIIKKMKVNQEQWFEYNDWDRIFE